MRFAYPVEIVEDGDGFTVTCPDVPEMVTDGGTRAEALARAADALISALSFYVDDGRPLPFPRWRPRNSRFTTHARRRRLKCRTGAPTEDQRKKHPAPAGSAASKPDRHRRSRPEGARQTSRNLRVGKRNARKPTAQGDAFCQAPPRSCASLFSCGTSFGHDHCKQVPGCRPKRTLTERRQIDKSITRRNPL
jgi:predicted RNase H-like HicB family nuclease